MKSEPKYITVLYSNNLTDPVKRDIVYLLDRLFLNQNYVMITGGCIGSTCFQTYKDIPSNKLDDFVRKLLGTGFPLDIAVHQEQQAMNVPT